VTARLKGTALKPSFDYIRSRLGEDVWAEIFERLTPEQRREINFLQTTQHYPVSLPGAVHTALVEVACQGNRHHAEMILRDIGRVTADHMLTGVYSVFVRHGDPHKMLPRIGHVLETLYEGAHCDLHHEEGSGHAVVQVHGLLDFSYCAPRLCGWSERALERSGAKHARVIERTWRAGKSASNLLIFEADWA
jgi:hypothetical protein